jgi:hypothetical protein
MADRSYLLLEIAEGNGGIAVAIYSGGFKLPSRSEGR